MHWDALCDLLDDKNNKSPCWETETRISHGRAHSTYRRNQSLTDCMCMSMCIEGDVHARLERHLMTRRQIPFVRVFCC